MTMSTIRNLPFSFQSQRILQSFAIQAEQLVSCLTFPFHLGWPARYYTIHIAVFPEPQLREAVLWIISSWSPVTDWFPLNTIKSHLVSYFSVALPLEGRCWDRIHLCSLWDISYPSSLKRKWWGEWIISSNGIVSFDYVDLDWWLQVNQSTWLSSIGHIWDSTVGFHVQSILAPLLQLSLSAPFSIWNYLKHYVLPVKVWSKKVNFGLGFPSYTAFRV